MKEEKGEHFADAYSQKLSNTHLIIARKTSAPSEVDANSFWFETLGLESPVKQVPSELSVRDPTESRSIVKIRGRKKGMKPKAHTDGFTPTREVTVDKSGNVISVKKVEE